MSINILKIKLSSSLKVYLAGLCRHLFTNSCKSPKIENQSDYKSYLIIEIFQAASQRKQIPFLNLTREILNNFTDVKLCIAQIESRWPNLRFHLIIDCLRYYLAVNKPASSVAAHFLSK